MVEITGSCARLTSRLTECESEIKQIVTNFRVIAGKLETINRSFYLENDEKIMYDIITTEVRIRNVTV
jgi:hypothetical protein